MTTRSSQPAAGTVLISLAADLLAAVLADLVYLNPQTAVKWSQLRWDVVPQAHLMARPSNLAHEEGYDRVSGSPSSPPCSTFPRGSARC